MKISILISRTLIALAALLLATFSWLGQAPMARANGITVTSAADTLANDGACTLREAILNANANDQSGSTDCASGGGSSDTITFDGDYTIILASTLSLDSDLNIDGSGRNVTVSGNNAVQVFTVGAGGPVTLNHLTIINGSSVNGGGIRVTGGATLTLLNSTLSHNSANIGGGIYNGGTLTVSNSTLSNNSAIQGGQGGGIQNFGTLTINNSTLSGNSAEASGGGIHNGIDNTLTINNSTLSSNSAGNRGGGISNNGLSTISNSTLSDNSAVNGGGIENAATGTLTLINSTLSDNSAGNAGGGVLNDGTLNFSNSLIANSGGGDCNNLGTIGTNLNNLVESGGCDAALSGDPLLGPLQDNGGDTLTHALLPGSPAIDAGDNAVCAAPPVNNLDQRGLPRPVDGDSKGAAICDIGSVEVTATPISFRVFFKNLDRFNEAAGSPPLVVSFDDISADTDLTGQTVAGVTFDLGNPSAPSAPLLVVPGAETFTPPGGFSQVDDPLRNRLFPTSGANVLSPGGRELAPGPNPSLEDDSLRLTFAAPVTAVGFDLLFQSLDDDSFVAITVLGPGGETLYSNPRIPSGSEAGGGPGDHLFVGFVSGAANISQIVVTEFDSDNTFPDSNIGYDSVRFR